VVQRVLDVSLRVWYQLEAQRLYFQTYAFSLCISGKIEGNFEKAGLGDLAESAFSKFPSIFPKMHDKKA
jgi:hypothetical protein